MQLDQAAHQRQAKAGALKGARIIVLRLKERLADFRQIALADANPRVGNRENQAGVFSFGAELDRAALSA